MNEYVQAIKYVWDFWLFEAALFAAGVYAAYWFYKKMEGNQPSYKPVKWIAGALLVSALIGAAMYYFSLPGEPQKMQNGPKFVN